MYWLIYWRRTQNKTFYLNCFDCFPHPDLSICHQVMGHCIVYTFKILSCVDEYFYADDIWL